MYIFKKRFIFILVCHKGPVLRYKKKMKTSRYQVFVSTGGTEYPRPTRFLMRDPKAKQMVLLHKSTEFVATSRGGNTSN